MDDDTTDRVSLWGVITLTHGNIDDLKDLFRHTGWEVLREILKSEKDVKSSFLLDNASLKSSDSDEVMKTVGERALINQILALPADIDDVIAELRKPTE